MDAAGLQRSEISFRRTGSSGLVWDDKFLGELAKIKPASQDDPPRVSTSDPTPTLLQRSRSVGGVSVTLSKDKQPTAKATVAVEVPVEKQGYKTMKEPSPLEDPPSPKVSGCGGICSLFGGGEKRKKSGGGGGGGGGRRAKLGKRKV